MIHAHVLAHRFYDTSRLPLHSTRADLKSKPELFTAGGKKGRELNAPPREAPRSAFERSTPSRARWARASAALSSSKNSRFSRGTGRCDAKTMDLPLLSYIAANSIAGAFLTSFASGCNPPAKVCKKGFKCEPGAVEPTSRRPATIPRDENLEANSRNGSHDP
jgi:hypothetical protein